MNFKSPWLTHELTEALLRTTKFAVVIARTNFIETNFIVRSCNIGREREILTHCAEKISDAVPRHDRQDALPREVALHCQLYISSASLFS